MKKIKPLQKEVINIEKIKFAHIIRIRAKKDRQIFFHDNKSFVF